MGVGPSTTGVKSLSNVRRASTNVANPTSRFSDFQSIFTAILAIALLSLGALRSLGSKHQSLDGTRAPSARIRNGSMSWIREANSAMEEREETEKGSSQSNGEHGATECGLREEFNFSVRLRFSVPLWLPVPSVPSVASSEQPRPASQSALSPSSSRPSHRNALLRRCAASSDRSRTARPGRG